MLTRSIAAFCDYLIVERGLAENTAVSYRYDLTDFAVFLQSRGISAPAEISRELILDYLLALVEEQRKTTSLSRHLSAIRAYCKFLVLDRWVAADPAQNLDSPRLEHYYPRIIYAEQVQRLLARWFARPRHAGIALCIGFACFRTGACEAGGCQYGAGLSSLPGQG